MSGEQTPFMTAVQKSPSPLSSRIAEPLPAVSPFGASGGFGSFGGFASTGAPSAGTNPSVPPLAAGDALVTSFDIMYVRVLSILGQVSDTAPQDL